MISTRRRRLAAIVLAVSAPLMLSACGTSFNAQTNQQYQAGIGSNQRTDSVSFFNALLVANEDGTLSFSGTLVNNSDAVQNVTGVSITPSGSTTATPVETNSAIKLKSGEDLNVGPDGQLAGIAVKDVVAGQYANVNFTFSDAGEVSVDVPVVTRTGMYDSVPAAAPSENASS